MNVIAGNTQKCLGHLLQRKDVSPIIERFCGVSRGTVRRWEKGGLISSGVTALKIQYLLEKLGYEVSELQALSPEIRDFGRLIGHGIVSIEKAATSLDLASGHLREVLAGRCGTSRRCAVLMKSMYEAHKRELQTTKLVEERPAKQSVVLPGNGAKSSNESTLEVLATHIRAMLPLAQLVASDAFTAEDRDKLRKMASEDGYAVFYLKNALVALCGERVRSQQHEGEPSHATA